MNFSLPMVFHHNFNFAKGSIVFCCNKGVSQTDVIGHKAGYEKDILKRLYGALKHMGYKIPYGRKLLSFEAPFAAKISHEHCQLAVLLCVLASSNQIELNKSLSRTLFLASVDLDGSLRDEPTILASVLACDPREYTEIVLPVSMAWLTTYLPNYPLIFFADAPSLITWLIEQKNPSAPVEAPKTAQSILPDFQAFDSIQGQTAAKRALLLSLAGKHHLLMAGSAGVGKTMLTKAISCFHYIPQKMHLLKKSWHNYWNHFGLHSHTPGAATVQSGFTRPQLLGAKHQPYGLIAQAYFGTLHVNELADCTKTQLSSLKAIFDSCQHSFDLRALLQKHPVIVVATTNLCPCGSWGTSEKCHCTAYRRLSYVGKLQQPLLERFSLGIILEKESKQTKQAPPPETTAQTYQRLLNNSLNQQHVRYAQSGKLANQDLQLVDFKELSLLSEKEWQLYQRLVVSHRLSQRSATNLLRVALTIADFDHSHTILKSHLLESLGYQLLPYTLHTR